MAVNAYDVQVCLWKILKLSSKTCVTYSIKYPYLSCSLLGLFLLYMSFPLVFWVLVYSFPLIVCTWIILTISLNLRDGKKYEKEEPKGEENGGKTKCAADDFASDSENKKSFARVHSVRRRRAKDIWREDNKDNNNQHSVEEKHAEEKNAVSSTNFNCDMVDKNALTEESPKEIREVEVGYSLVNTSKGTSSSSPLAAAASQILIHHEFEKSFKDDDGNDIKAKEGNEDEQKNVMDVGISESERNKRLESLIARRRSRKLLSLQVRRTLMNMDRNDHPGPITSLIIPKHNSPTNIPGPFSPGPGSAPSVLVPMRNPFDLPYDPQEEKPDLTGDSFQQEFMSANNRDMVFCRHESFSLGPFLPAEFNQIREQSSLVRGQRASSLSKPTNEFDREFDPIIEQESYEMPESKTATIESSDDQIKEIIQVHENDAHNNTEEDTDGVQTRPIPREDCSNSSISASSSEEDQPVYKIDKEAILKSLSMARRNAAEETENNDPIGDHLNSATSAFENTRLKEQFYHADKTMQQHKTSYSIASDLQVEVSEVSSPPLTIDENFSYQDENISTCDEDMEKRVTWDSEGSWAGSSSLLEVDEDESRTTEVDEFSEQDTNNEVGFSRINKPEFYDSGQAHATNLQEKIHETLQEDNFSFQVHENKEESGRDLVPHPSQEDDSLKSVGDNTFQMKQFETTESETVEQILGQSGRSNDCHGMEHLTIESIKLSEDSEEILKPEQEEMVKETTVVQNHVDLESVQHSEGEQSSPEVSITQTTVDSSDPQAPSPTPNVAAEQFPVFQTSSLLSPKSVLLPTFSMDQGYRSSFGHDTDEEVQQISTQNTEVSSPVAFQNSTTLTEHSLDVEVLQESLERSKMSTTEADNTESANKQEFHQNGIEPIEVASSSSSQTEGSQEAPVKLLKPTIEETSPGSFNNNDEVSRENIEAANQTAFHNITDPTDNSNSSLATEQDLSGHQEKVIGEVTENDSKNPTTDEDQRENPALHEDTGHDQHYLNKPRDQERQTNSITSNYFDQTKEELQPYDADETTMALSLLAEDNVNSQSYQKSENDREPTQHANSDESMPAPELETINNSSNETK